MIRFVIVILVILVILFILRSRSDKLKNISKSKYKFLIISIIVFAILFLIATSGRFIFPQIFQLLKVGLPFLTKFIGI